MTDCCSGVRAAIAGQFDADTARKDRERYRKKGPDATTRILTEEIADAGGGESLLDIGAGVGALCFELLDAGFQRALSVDASPAYAAAAREEAEARGLGDRFRVLEGDFTEVADEVEAADVVTMNRVVCCYPRYRPLLERAVERSGRLFAYAYPRDRWYIRPVVRLHNLVRAALRDPFRAFVHPADQMGACIEEGGFRRVSRSGTFVWAVDVYARAGI
ncbi:MAG TPA: class I SAM-dependent methyltransferase [Longimicrobiales bacterium]|nr:class I SAM-dependent methyltransferase [Longimicrobiales bacterium]